MNSTRVLVIEDLRWVSNQVAPLLQNHGYAVDFAHSGADGERLAIAGSYEAVVLNVTILGNKAAAVLARIRERGLPILAVEDPAATSQWPLDTRADQVLTRPIQPSALLACLRTMSREARALKHATMRLGALELDMARHEARRGERRIILTALEYKLLVLLLENEGRVLTRTQLAEQVWGVNSSNCSNMVNVAVLRLRRKVDGAGEPTLIHTVRGSGYRADAE